LDIDFTMITMELTGEGRVRILVDLIKTYKMVLFTVFEKYKKSMTGYGQPMNSLNVQPSNLNLNGYRSPLGSQVISSCICIHRTLESDLLF